MAHEVNNTQEVKIKTAPHNLPADDLLHQAEIQTLQLHSTGRALRAVADLTRRTGALEGEYIEQTRRDDVACLMEVLGENILQRTRAVEVLLSSGIPLPDNR